MYSWNTTINAACLLLTCSNHWQSSQQQPSRVAPTFSLIRPQVLRAEWHLLWHLHYLASNVTWHVFQCAGGDKAHKCGHTLQIDILTFPSYMREKKPTLIIGKFFQTEKDHSSSKTKTNQTDRSLSLCSYRDSRKEITRDTILIRASVQSVQMWRAP